MIGRLDAPGAKLDPVMPGFSNRRSPSVEAPLRRNSSFGTTVMVANWSVTIGIVPFSVSVDGAAGWGAQAVSARAAVKDVRARVNDRAGDCNIDLWQRGLRGSCRGHQKHMKMRPMMQDTSSNEDALQTPSDWNDIAPRACA